MNSSFDIHPSDFQNPFCTRRIRPGALSYLFPDDAAIGDLIDRLSLNQWLGEIVGPHGSGKSTLLVQLITAIEQIGRQPVLFELHDGQRRLPGDWRGKIELAASTAPAIVVVDGYEQLSLWSRFCLKRYCRRRRLGLLISSHASAGLPGIYRTSTSPQMSLQIVKQLMQNQNTAIPDNIVAELFIRHGGNMRELLFDLYDVFEDGIE